MHPRPSPIVAALYTLRDLDADVIIVHGPSGCCFRAARLLWPDIRQVVGYELRITFDVLSVLICGENVNPYFMKLSFDALFSD